jgi:hypothetical protein
MRRRLLLLVPITLSAILLIRQFEDLGALFRDIGNPQNDSSAGSQKMNSGVIELSLGQSGADVVKQSKIAIKRGQTAGLVF